jgi:hypothetical protein
MSVVEIAAAVVSVLMVASRFLQAAKPVWDRFPKVVAVALPVVVAMIPQVVDLIGQSKTTVDFINYVIASVALVVVGLLPKSAADSAK